MGSHAQHVNGQIFAQQHRKVQAPDAKYRGYGDRGKAFTLAAGRPDSSENGRVADQTLKNSPCGEGVGQEEIHNPCQGRPVSGGAAARGGVNKRWIIPGWCWVCSAEFLRPELRAGVPSLSAFTGSSAVRRLGDAKGAFTVARAARARAGAAAALGAHGRRSHEVPRGGVAGGLRASPAASEA